MKTLNTQNDRLNKIQNVLAKAKDDRATIVNDVIALIVEESKGFKDKFTSKRVAQKFIIDTMLEDVKTQEVNNYMKRALYVSKAILVDGYIIKKEWLSLAQAEQAVRCDKREINGAMDNDSEEEYLEAIKDIIAERKREQAIKTLNDAGALDTLIELQRTHGQDVRKILNAMLNAL